MNANSVLLLGGGGFIGQALTRYLYKKNYSIHILSPDIIKSSVQHIRVHRGRLDNKTILKKVLPRCDIIIHLASATTPSDSIKGPVFEVEHNVFPTIRFLEHLQQYSHIKRFIFISSGGALYTPSPDTPVSEHQLLHAISYYGAGKIAIESFLNVFANIHGINMTIIRPSNLYGPGQPFRKGFGLIRTMLAHILNDAVMEIWGDGETVRDFMYIDDMVRILEKIITTAGINGVYNVGLNKGYSINQVINIVEKTTRKKLHVNYKPHRKFDMNKVNMDCTKLISKTGCKPSVDLQEGIAKTWEWVKNQKNDE